jgi:RNA polymerase sigma-70 factor (ECF subfamily)
VETSRELESFLRSISTRAFRIARIGLRDDQDALDAVQEAMIRLVRNYGSRPATEWAPLFYAILRNCVNDQLRGRQSRHSLITWFRRLAFSDDAVVPDVAGPAQQAESGQGLARLERAIARLPPRQQQAFLLRNVEELDVRETAVAMGCSEGSVKTHYSRAVQALREHLGEV